MIRPLTLALLFAGLVPAAAATGVIAKAGEKLRYDNCLKETVSNPAAALDLATKWNNGGPPAQHCAALALVGLKRYSEAAQKLDALGRAPGMGELRPALFDQAGNAWLLAGEISKAIASFEGALALSSRDPDTYVDLARAQAMQSDWPDVESDLNAALSLSPNRIDLLVLRASARRAQNLLTEARADIQSALAISPGNPDAMLERGSIERDSGNFVKARADFQSTLKLRPSPQTEDAAQRNLAALDAAQKAATPPKKK